MPLPTDPSSNPVMSPDDFDALEAILDDLRTRDEEVPQWEFCEGFIAALLCCRRPIARSEYLPELLGCDVDPENAAVPAVFADAQQFERFMDLWLRRFEEVSTALGVPAETLAEANTYQPEVMDLRGAVAALTPEQRADMGDAPVPSFGQIWAIGFMYAVESWPDQWALPRDRDAASVIDAALQSIIALTEDDTNPPTVCAFDDGGTPSMSQQRLDDFASAIWAVYDLYQAWHSIGPRVETIRMGDKTGRNDPCPCGSGKKFKKCCGA
ncbi:MAG: UPF0149 family protein [Rhodoferax sp.]|nr:UPF0149 family protein [Rhodoferax sp.]